MTAICPAAGPSHPIPGTAGTVQLTTAGLAGLAANWPIQWAVPFYVGLEAINLTLPTFCALDPPADPGFTAADGLAMLNVFGNPVGYATASAKLQQLILRFAWYQFCECVTAPTPAAPAAPAAPAGLPDLRPTLPTVYVPCLGPIFQGIDATTNNVGTYTHIDLSNWFWPFVGLPNNIRYAHIKFCSVSMGVTHGSFTFVLKWQSADHSTTLLTETFNVAAGTCFETDFERPIGAGRLLITTLAVPQGITDGESIALNFYCNSFTPGNDAPVATPDPTTQGMLQHIMAQVDLIQRQNVPFAYVSGTVHAGLSGNGVIAIQGILGARVDVTAGLATLRSVGNLPPYYFGGGYITFGTADGYPSSYRLKHSPLLCMPPRCSAYTLLAYDLPPGVTVTITELVREP